MIVDYRTLDVSQPIEVDLCIIGAGAAGIAIARHFAGSKTTVALLESGGYEHDPQLQALYAGDSIGEPYYETLDHCRSRRFGGSTNCWGGMCTPLTEIDFRERSWVPYSGWPVTETEMDPYFRRAHDLCGVGPYGYDAAMWEIIGKPALPLNGDLLWSHFWQMNNRYGNKHIRFAKKFQAELEQATNVSVYLHANVVGLMLDDNGRRMSWVRTKTLDGRTGSVKAKHFVLACGGIENVRMLLVSNDKMPAGIGNENDLVGRFFNEHLQAECATVTIPASGSKLVDYAHWWNLGRSHARPGMTLSPVAQQKHETLNASISIDAVYDANYVWKAAKDLWTDIVNRKVGIRSAESLTKMLTQTHVMIPDTYRRMRYGTRPIGKPKSFVLYARAEQAPIPESRIRLGNDLDQLGMRKSVLDWHTSEIDHRSFRLLIETTKSEFARLGLGDVHEAEWMRDGGWPDSLAGGPHHMCTTRMADDPKQGVVDRNAKIYGIDSLYIAGSSVFATGGHANSTLTLLATTMKLCDHLELLFS